MKKILLGTLIVVITLCFSASAIAGMIIPAANQVKDKAKASEKSVIGENWDLTRVDFIHYAKPDKPGKPDGNKGKSEKDVCSKLMGVKWKETPVDYYINPTNPEGLSDSFVIETMSVSVDVWDTETATDLFSDTYFVDYGVDYGVQDYKNAIVFGDYDNDNVIAVTSVWYTPRGKRIVEFDILFNTRFDWGNAFNDPSLMDLSNIAIHELGHAVGLADVYNDQCSEVTMYGYSQEGETDKRSLEQSDISGLQRLYGGF